MSDYFDRLLGRAGRRPEPALVQPDRQLWSGPSATARQSSDAFAESALAGEEPPGTTPPGRQPHSEDQHGEYRHGERPGSADGRRSSTDRVRPRRRGLGDRNPARSRRRRITAEPAESTAGGPADVGSVRPEPPGERTAGSSDGASAASMSPFDGLASGTDQRRERGGEADPLDPTLATEPAATDDPTYPVTPTAPSTDLDRSSGTGAAELRADFGPDPDAETLRSELERVDALMFDAAGVEAATHLGDESALPVVAPTSAAASMPDPPGSDRVHIDHLSIEIVGPPTAAHSPPQRHAGAVPRATAQLGSGPVAWRRS